MPTLYVRNADPDTVKALRKAARLRGWTVAEYLAALVRLHESMRTSTDHVLLSQLREHDLAPVVES